MFACKGSKRGFGIPTVEMITMSLIIPSRIILARTKFTILFRFDQNSLVLMREKTAGSKSLIVTARCTKHNCRRSPLWTRLSERGPHFGLGKCKKCKRLRKEIQKAG